MSSSYLNPATKKLVKQVATLDNRTMDGVIRSLCLQRLSQLGVDPDDNQSSVNCIDETTGGGAGRQDKNSNNVKKAEGGAAA